MAGDFHFTLKNQLSDLAPLAEQVRTAVADLGLTERDFFCIDLVCDELITNTIKYGYDDTKEHEIGVHVSVQPTEIVIELKDDGHPFNPLESATPDTNLAMQERPIGGLGIHLLREMMDRCEYRHTDGKNCVTFQKSR
ncbi:MAG: ATP-binding protein [Chthoniobacter sp.]|uniref:ATP-binding protein n=1 Tax=Chthoniobacter sp. TaxID=2510640 RepID=UPI0032A2B04F